MQTERLAYFDQMKGVAIFSMVVGHVLLFSFGIDHCSLSNSLNLFAMPVFFYVSGYFAYRSLCNIREFGSYIFRKSIRLLLPWLFATFLYCMYSGRSFFNIFTEFYWFFYILFILTLLFSLLDFVLLRFTKSAYPILILFVPIILGVLTYLYEDTTSIPLNALTRYSCFFLSGWICKKYKKVHELILNSSVLNICSIVLYIYGCFHYLELNIILRTASSLGAIILMQSFFYQNRFNTGSKIMNAFTFMGQNTIAIYIFNNYFLPDLKCLLGGAFINMTHSWIIELIFSSCLSIPIVLMCVLIKIIFRNNRFLNRIVS